MNNSGTNTQIKMFANSSAEEPFNVLVFHNGYATTISQSPLYKTINNINTYGSYALKVLIVGSKYICHVSLKCRI